MSQIVAHEPSVDRTRPREADSMQARPFRELLAATWVEQVTLIGFFAVLPIERVLTLDVGGFTIRPALLFMALFLALNLGRLRPGFAAMPTVALVVLAILVSIPASHDLKRSLAYTGWAFFTIAFALAAVGRLREDRIRMASWVELYCATAAAWGVVGIAQWFGSFVHADLAYGWLGSLPRLHGLTLESSFFAFYLIPALFLTVAARRKVWAIPILLALILSTSRSGGLGIIVGTAVVLVLSDRPGRMLVAKAVPVVAVSAVLLAVPLAVDYQPIGSVPGTITPEQAQLGIKSARFYGEFGSLQDDASVAPRLQSWRDGWETYKQAPVTGVGINAFGQAQHDRGASLDWPVSLLKTTNLWVESLAEMGPLGLFALVAWAFAPLPLLARRRRKDPFAVPLLAALLASSAMFAFTQTWWVPYRWVPWIFAYALVGSEFTRWARARAGR